MKNKIIIAIVLNAALLAGTARASTLWFSGIVPANTTTNPVALVQIGTFNFTSPGFYSQVFGTDTNTYVRPRLTFDGTNFYAIPQAWQAPGTVTNQLFLLTNSSYPVYMALAISNGLASPITNNVTSQP